MAEKVGKMITCDRCGNSVFLECIGEGETDGGYTRWNNFEAAPESWAYHLDVGRLCPKCNAEYENMIKQFMNKTVSNTRASDKTPDWFTGGGRDDIVG